MKTLREMMDIIENNSADLEEYENLAKLFAHLYYGDFSATEQVRLANNIYDKLVSGELSAAQVRADIRELDAELNNQQQTDDYFDQGVTEAMGKNDLITNLSKDLEKVRKSKHRGDPNVWAKGDLYTGARDQEDIDQMSRRDTSEPRPTAKQRAKDLSARAKRNSSVEEDQATAQMGLMSAVGSNDNNPAEQRRAMAQQAVEQLAAKNNK